MALNGISTLPKSSRALAKLQLAQVKRQAVGTIAYRPLNVIVTSEIDPPRTTPLILGRPWST